MSDLISRQDVIDRINKQREHLRPYLYPQDKIGDSAYRICAEFIERLPSAEPKIKCVAKVTLSQEQIQDAVDKAVEKMKAELEPCDFCKHKDDCGYMSMYCPAERREYE